MYLAFVLSILCKISLKECNLLVSQFHKSVLSVSLKLVKNKFALSSTFIKLYTFDEIPNEETNKLPVFGVSNNILLQIAHILFPEFHLHDWLHVFNRIGVCRLRGLFYRGDAISCVQSVHARFGVSVRCLLEAPMQCNLSQTIFVKTSVNNFDRV